METKRVVVLMPFRNDDKIEARRAILDFLRLKYLITKINADLGAKRSPVSFAARVAKTATDEIPDRVLTEVATADVVVAILQGQNVNVLYEVAFRHVLRGQMILLVHGDPEVEIPVYLKTRAHLIVNSVPEIEKEIHSVAESRIAKYQAIDFEDDDPPETLRDAIDQFGQKEQRALQDALIEAVNQPAEPSPLVMRALPGRPLRLSHWAEYLYFPVSIIEMEWKRMGDLSGKQYVAEDLVGEPRIFDANSWFYQLYEPFAASYDHCTTLADLVGNLKRFMEPSDLEAFTADQLRLRDELVFKNQPTGARVPIRLNRSHPLFRDRIFLPVVMGKKIEPNRPSQPHKTYLIIIYVELGDHLRVN